MERYGGFFEDLGALKPDACVQESDVLARARDGAARCASFHVSFTGVAAGSSYFQCVYLLVDPTTAVVAANKAFSAAMGPLRKWSPNPVYMPHVSVLYGDLDNSAKQDAIDQLRADYPGALQAGYAVRQVAIYETAADDKLMTTWREIAVLQLGHGAP